MTLIEIKELDNKAHKNMTTLNDIELPDGQAIVPDDIEIPDSFPFVDIETSEIDGVVTVTKMTASEQVINEKEFKQQLEKAKQTKIIESKTVLATYLEQHPILQSDGKYYSVTSEKQSLLTSNLALYQISAAVGAPFKLTWNSTGDECVEQTYENLAALALAIGTYVKPFVSRQQEIELEIKACKTEEEVDAINISYDINKEATT